MVCGEGGRVNALSVGAPIGDVPSTQDVLGGEGCSLGLALLSTRPASPLSLRQAQETRTAVASALQDGNLVSGSLSDMSKMPCY